MHADRLAERGLGGGVVAHLIVEDRTQEIAGLGLVGPQKIPSNWSTGGGSIAVTGDLRR
jgi:hypothetical protein